MHVFPIRILITKSLLLSTIVVLCRCNYRNETNTGSTSENQVDSSRFKKVAVSYIYGKQLFTKLCNKCHPAPDKDLLDQYLFDNLFERLPAPAEDYFVKYISDSRLLRASGNEHARKVDEVWNRDYEDC